LRQQGLDQGGRVGLQGAGDQDQVGEVCCAFVLALPLAALA